jgi:hypothetical protein
MFRVQKFNQEMNDEPAGLDEGFGGSMDGSGNVRGVRL